MFVFDKLLSPFLTPLGVALLLCAVVLLLLLFRRTRTAFTALLVATALLYLGSTPLVARGLSGLLERQYPSLRIDRLPTADAIILLGGAIEPALPPRQSPHLTRHADRIMLAADLFKAGKAQLIIASGGAWRYPTLDETEADDMASVLMRFGVPASAILKEDQSDDTADNARLSVLLMQQRQLHTALLVTSGIHMPRAMAAFERLGIPVTAAATDLVDVASPDWPALDWLPSPEALVETGEALHEFAGLAYYKLRGVT